MIPKKIHYCWFGGNPLPELAIKCIESWKKYCPDYEIIEWNESNFDVNALKYTKEAYENKKMAFVSDVARMYALVNIGGIYMDTDVELLKNLDELLNNIKTKRYTYNRLKRTLTYILLSITKEDFNNLILEYIRVLGFNNKGKIYLNKIKKEIDIPLLTNYDDKYLNQDLTINKIISLNSKIKDKKEFIEKEYKEKPIIK